jgi:hypothetical protein
MSPPSNPSKRSVVPMNPWKAIYNNTLLSLGWLDIVTSESSRGGSKHEIGAFNANEAGNNSNR